MAGIVFFFAAGALRNSVLFFVLPLTSSINALSEDMRAIGNTLIGIPGFSDEVRALRLEVVSLRSRLAAEKELERENELLRSTFGRKPEELALLYARVMARPLLALDESLVIDVGQKDGVAVGMKILLPGFIHIGSISGIGDRYAKVRLLSDVGEKAEVYIPEAGITSVAHGRGLGVVTIQVPSTISVGISEPVLTIGPPDFLAGYVVDVEKSDAGPFQNIITGLPINITDVRSVFVVKK